MKYSMVRQFSNNAIDNIFKFFYKISDFFKIFLDMIIAFFDIWYTFIMIFVYFFLYIYYFFLFLIDTGTESESTVFFWKKASTRTSYIPHVTITSGPNPIPAMYGGSKALARSAENITTTAVKSAKGVINSISSISTPSSSRAKKPIFKSLAQGIFLAFNDLRMFLMAPFKAFFMFFIRKLKPVKEDEVDKSGKSKSLIDEYMKEYQRKRR